MFSAITNFKAVLEFSHSLNEGHRIVSPHVVVAHKPRLQFTIPCLHLTPHPPQKAVRLQLMRWA